MSNQSSKAENLSSATASLDGRSGLVYARVSSKKQEIEGSGLKSQEDRCVAELASLNIPKEKTFSDSYSGGGDFMKRPAMRELLAYVDAHPHKKYLVVFDDLKRFARDTEFHLKLRAAFKARDVVLRCLNYNFDESPEGRFAETVMAAHAELERHQNRRQVVQKQKARLEAGYWPFNGKKAYVMVKDPAHRGKLAIPHDTEAPLLKEALEGFSTGVFVRRIDACRFLVERGFWKSQRPEKYIDDFTDMAKDPFYAGYIEYPKWEVPRCTGHHKAIITIETYDRNQKRLRKEELNKRVRIDVSNDFYLRGLIVCGECGSHLTGAWTKGRSKRYPYYICHNKSCPLYGKSIIAEIAETEFNNVLKGQGLKPSVEVLVKVVFDRVWKETISSLQDKEALLMQDRKRLEEKAKNLADMVIAAKSEYLKKVYEDQLEETAREIEQIDERSIRDIDLSIPYRTALEKAVGLLRNPYFIWGKLNVEEKQRLFYFIFEQKLPYTRNEGYRTAKIVGYTRLFEEFIPRNPHDVDQRGIEPLTSSLQMRRSATELLARIVRYTSR